MMQRTANENAAQKVKLTMSLAEPLYCKVFLQISDLNLMMLNWFCMRDDLEVIPFENSSHTE